jgi:hypothetical protein
MHASLLICQGCSSLFIFTKDCICMLECTSLCQKGIESKRKKGQCQKAKSVRLLHRRHFARRHNKREMKIKSIVQGQTGTASARDESNANAVLAAQGSASVARFPSLGHVHPLQHEACARCRSKEIKVSTSRGQIMTTSENVRRLPTW